MRTRLMNVYKTRENYEMWGFLYALDESVRANGLLLGLWVLLVARSMSLHVADSLRRISA